MLQLPDSLRAVTRYSTFPCWRPATPNPIPDHIQPPPRQSLWMTNPNSKSWKYSTQRLTTAVVPANYCILYVGQGMRVLTKKLLGYLLPNSDMLLNSLQISTLHTQPSLALYQVFPNSDFQPSGVLHSLRITLVFICSNHSKILSTVESFYITRCFQLYFRNTLRLLLWPHHPMLLTTISVSPPFWPSHLPDLRKRSPT